MNQFRWTNEQAAVISSPASSRLLVNAGPGTGKTATACGRVAWLIDQEQISPSNILIVSFTRAAIYELRARIASYLKSSGDAASVQITTIDSLVGRVSAGFGIGQAPSYEDSINVLAGLLETSQEIQDYFATFQHLIIDEAQDIVTPRSELLMDLVFALSKDKGVTIFCDEAQAIYGFADDHVGSLGGTTLPELVKEHMSAEFGELELSEIKRTKSKKLKAIFSLGREIIRNETSTQLESKYSLIRKEIERNSHGDAGSAEEILSTEDSLVKSGNFVLFRKRFDALLGAQLMESNSRKLRVSGFPRAIKPWIALCMSAHIEKTLTIEQFVELTSQTGLDWSDEQVAQHWEALVSYAGKSSGSVSMKILTQKLARGIHDPFFFYDDFGLDGPIIGTIHASKGREADDVFLFLPKSKVNSDESDDDEASVYFVGASRARTKLYVHEEDFVPSSRIYLTGRTWRWKPRNGIEPRKIQFELGREGDISAQGIAGKSYFRRSSDVEAAQERICSYLDSVFAIDIRQTHSMVREPNYAFAVLADANESSSTLCYLSNSVNMDMFRIRDMAKGKYGKQRGPLPQKVEGAVVLGVRTVVLAPDDPARLDLHSPWRESGIMLAPQIACLAEAIF